MLQRLIIPLRTVFETHIDALRLLQGCRSGDVLGVHPSLIPRFCIQALLEDARMGGVSGIECINEDYIYELMRWLEGDCDIDFGPLTEPELITVARYIEAVFIQIQRYIQDFSIYREGYFISAFGIEGFIGYDPILFIDYTPIGSTWSGNPHSASTQSRQSLPSHVAD